MEKDLKYNTYKVYIFIFLEFKGRFTLSRQEKSPHSTTQSQIFSVGTVRNILDLDNKEIAKLCAQVSLMPKKDMHGRTYFTKDDIELLTRTKNDNKSSKDNVTVHTETESSLPKEITKPQKKSLKSYATVPMKTQQSSENGSEVVPLRKQVQKQLQSAKLIQQDQTPVAPVVQKPIVPQSKSVEKICNSLTVMESNLLDKISELLEDKISTKLDEKLDGMDEVVVELVRCKTENETLRYKINELNKEVYNLKNELSRYKSLGLGLYIKKSGDSSLL